jgi:HAD superfamily hydrolase (TIGR01509 family)
VPLRGLVVDYAGVLTEAPELLDLVARAEAGDVRTALVTDAHAVPEPVANAFDLVVLGPALGVRKPDPELYRRVAARLRLRAEDCVVVDDQLRNLRGARSAGAVVVHHETGPVTADEVEALLGLPATG